MLRAAEPPIFISVPIIT